MSSFAPRVYLQLGAGNDRHPTAGRLQPTAGKLLQCPPGHGRPELGKDRVGHRIDDADDVDAFAFCSLLNDGRQRQPGRGSHFHGTRPAATDVHVQVGVESLHLSPLQRAQCCGASAQKGSGLLAEGTAHGAYLEIELCQEVEDNARGELPDPVPTGDPGRLKLRQDARALRLVQLRQGDLTGASRHRPRAVKEW